MSTTPYNFAIATIASEQIWPTIEFLMLAKQLSDKQHVKVAKVVILITDDEKFSKGPGESLRRFCEGVLDTVHDLRLLDDTSPASVRAELGRVVDEEHYWLLNATNGTKPMSFAVMEYVSRPNTKVLYKERNQPWGVVRLEPEFCIDLLNDRPSTLGDLSLDQILRTQFAIEGGTVETNENWTPLELDVAISAGFAWDDLTIGSEKKGNAFERFVATAVKKVSGAKVWCNVKVKKGTTLMESDVVALHEDRLYLFDCSLSQKEDKVYGSFVAQLERAETRRRSLGGLNANVVLVRPSWGPLSNDEKIHARHLGIQIWTYAEMFALYDHLARLFRVAAADVADLQRQLATAQRSMGDPSLSGALLREKPKSAFASLDVTIAELIKQDGQACFAFCGVHVVVVDEDVKTWPSNWARFRAKKTTLVALPPSRRGSADPRKPTELVEELSRLRRRRE